MGSDDMISRKQAMKKRDRKQQSMFDLDYDFYEKYNTVYVP